eukprot:COSAG01_NODE_7386_length_3228_cov_2.367732_1_plen_60_part_10
MQNIKNPACQERGAGCSLSDTDEDPELQQLSHAVTAAWRAATSGASSTDEYSDTDETAAA